MYPHNAMWIHNFDTHHNNGSHHTLTQELPFAGSDSGEERAAAMYSLLGSANLNGLDPEIYLHQVLERIADHPISRIDDLVPWNLALGTTPAPS